MPVFGLHSEWKYPTFANLREINHHLYFFVEKFPAGYLFLLYFAYRGWSWIQPTHRVWQGQYGQMSLYTSLESKSPLCPPIISWVKVFRIIPEFRILRLTFCGKSAFKCWISLILIASLIILCLFKDIYQLNLNLWIFSRDTASFMIGISEVQDFGNFELSFL